MKKYLFSIILVAMVIPAISFATNTVTEARIQTVRHYLSNLQNKDAKAMQQLFVDKGRVISTSKGSVSADEFFNNFLPELTFAEVKLSQVYQSLNDTNHLGAKFHFSYKLKNGEQGGGEYIDDFVFSNNSAKLTMVHMFENLK